MEGIETIRQGIEEIKEELNSLGSAGAEDFRIAYLGKKGKLRGLYDMMKEVAPESKKEAGQLLNSLKSVLEKQWEVLKSSSATDSSKEKQDLSRPGMDTGSGSRHPISIVKDEIVDIFSRIGFSISEGPEIEDDWHNFSALNFPPEHPARDMQDTFFVDEEHALRTHTSSVQVRVMEGSKPPIRTISPGRVFRNEAISARSHCIFHQIEGLYIDKDVSFAELKQTLLYFVKEFFGPKSDIRLRPSYFPFTEPSAEVDVYWGLETEADYRITKGTGWLEVMGCGMVDPAVLSNAGIDPSEYSGFAFGMGVERIAMLRYQIPDIRYFFENDIRFLSQFKAAR